MFEGQGGDPVGEREGSLSTARFSHLAHSTSPGPHHLTPASPAPLLLPLQACSTVISMSARFLIDFATVLTHLHNGRGKRGGGFPVDCLISQWDKNHQFSLEES